MSTTFAGTTDIGGEGREQGFEELSLISTPAHFLNANEHNRDQSTDFLPLVLRFLIYNTFLTGVS